MIGYHQDCKDGGDAAPARFGIVGNPDIAAPLPERARFLEPDPAQQALVARMKELRAGGASVRAIQSALEAEGERVALATIAKVTAEGGSPAPQA